MSIVVVNQTFDVDFREQWQICFKNINQVKTYKFISVKDKIIHSVDYF